MSAGGGYLRLAGLEGSHKPLVTPETRDVLGLPGVCVELVELERTAGILERRMCCLLDGDAQTLLDECGQLAGLVGLGSERREGRGVADEVAGGFENYKVFSRSN